ncbi:Uncaracterized surface protein containing fasciclin (FAS1) repeats [Arenibacter palladensis]|uniref:Uncaracterized surface protein containing fasciclin (FAS1) repeats n=1 Tax=Arenibacter palladensis TaxID=237373 RepID=A0A1M5G2V9_9FLAO|nr:fasciclin domain-containing protein [Arenibacter palladensis]SHF98137.1 Uncaracterized surface protein containing fasciclin (FAS1) repeats [Arenibacter palladensis]
MRSYVSVCALLFLITSIAYGQTSFTENSFLKTENSIIESAADSGHHYTLLEAVKAANLDKILNEDGPFTVFAPSDMAFRKLSKVNLKELLLPENKKELFSLLTYHIVAGNITASKILKALCNGNGKASFTTVQGDKIFASMDGLDIVLTDKAGNKAKITSADANQCNGIIHEIDSVILPNSLSAANLP